MVQSQSPFITGANEISWWRTEIGDQERATILDSLARERISQGPVTAELEAEICRTLNVGHAVATTSGSVALLMACIALDIGSGDEVIVPTRTFIATAHAPFLLGAKIVLADCLEHVPSVDPAEIENKITSRTKAILPVHLNGRGCDMERINAIARRHGIAVIEDAAQAFHSRHRDGSFMGSNSFAGCFSFGMVKITSSGQGGAIITNSKSTADRLRAIRNHGVRDVISHEYLESGGNFKFSDILASMALWQVRRAPERARHCNAIYRMYADALKNHPAIRMVPVDIDQGEVAVWSEAVAADREAVMAHLSAHGIQSRKFLPCLHSARHLKATERFPNSERFGRDGFNLPCGPTQPLANIEQVIDVLARFS